jgi:hypothetical protein
MSKQYKIEWSRNDIAIQQWQLWAHGYPTFTIADNECKKLKYRNVDFDFRVVKQDKDSD